MSEKKIEEMSLEELSERSQDFRKRINLFRGSLSQYFIKREKIVDLMTVCAIAQEPLLLVGVPGTAKSDLITKFRDALGIRAEDYFEYMLTKFTEPSEVMGPIDIEKLREGRYLRRVEGKLPTAKMVFLDEIFKSNSAILNSLLTIINERKYYQDGKAVPVALEILFGATNEIPDNVELGALKDRFCLKAICESVRETDFEGLLDAGLDAQTQRDLGQKPWVEGHSSLEDIKMAHRYLALQMARKDLDGKSQTQRDRHLYFQDEMIAEFRRILDTLTKEDNVFISDRKVIKLYKLLRTHAWLMHGGKVERDDLAILSHLGESIDELKLLDEKVPMLLGAG